MKIRIREIFYSIQGEGVYAGLPTVFIRFAGCNLIPKCTFCDSNYSWDPAGGKDMESNEVVEAVKKYSPYRKEWVCITGGEPLWQEDALEALVRELRRNGYKITVETNGSFPPPSWYTLVDSWNADIKCPSTGVASISDESWLKMRQQDQVKFVVGNDSDLNFVRQVLGRHGGAKPTILVSPAMPRVGRPEDISALWCNRWLQEVADFCKDLRVRFSLQIHKFIWGDKQGV